MAGVTGVTTARSLLLASVETQLAPIVLELGVCSCKVGVAGEPSPRFILPTHQFTSHSLLSHLSPSGNVAPQHKATRCAFSSISSDSYFPALSNLLHFVFSQLLLLSPSSRRIVLLEPPLSPSPYRQCLVDLLFRSWRIDSVCFLPSPLAALYTVGLSSGLAVDVGGLLVRAMPVSCSYPVYRAYREGGAGALAVLAKFRQSLLGEQRGEEDLACHLNYLVVEDVLSRVGFVRCADWKHSATAETFPLRTADGRNINITIQPQQRWECYEALFEGDGSVQSLVIESLLACPRDCRVGLLENVLLCGGLSEVKGFLRRLCEELSLLLGATPLLRHLAGNVAFGCPPFPPVLRSWVGGSLHASLSSSLQVYTQGDFTSKRPLPDWVIGE
eukprot:GHVS01105432.1.p1 GENE.GHVS01105432.1~~GHVS01105432.1.p1  ORF type:complete len:387 (+),score=51.99 GHVS01105432.1:1297-2457(+)